MAGGVELVCDDAGRIIAGKALGMTLKFATIKIPCQRATHQVLLFRATGPVNLGRVEDIDMAAFGAALACCTPDDEMSQMIAETAATSIEHAVYDLVVREHVGAARDEALVRIGWPAGPVAGFEAMARHAVRAIMDAPCSEQLSNVATLVDLFAVL
jgi:hypothetical protein